MGKTAWDDPDPFRKEEVLNRTYAGARRTGVFSREEVRRQGAPSLLYRVLIFRRERAGVKAEAVRRRIGESLPGVGIC